MIIVSQDGLRTTESLELEICVGQIKEVRSGRIFGNYETEERAKEVLEEIVEQYEHEKECKCDRSYLETLDNFTYKMPEE